MYTDFENLLDPKIKKFYLASLKTGMARRSFIYMPTKSKAVLSHPQRPQACAKAIEDLLSLQRQYFTLFSTLLEMRDKVYKIAPNAAELLYQYHCNCIDYFNNSKSDPIIGIEKKESFWKITKLAVTYSIIDNPTEMFVDEKYVQMAIEFYKNIEPSLRAVIDKREDTQIEKFAQFISDNRDKIITMTMLRKSGIIGQVNFGKFIQNNIEDIADELQSTYGLILKQYKGNKNQKGYQVVNISNSEDDPLEDCFA